MTRMISPIRQSSLLVRYALIALYQHHFSYEFPHPRLPGSGLREKRLTATTDKKARDELAGKVGKGKGPLNTGSQGIKKSGKK